MTQRRAGMLVTIVDSFLARQSIAVGEDFDLHLRVAWVRPRFAGDVSRNLHGGCAPDGP